MRVVSVFCALTAFGVALSPVAAADTYTFQVPKKKEVGTRERNDVVETDDTNFTVKDATGGVLDQKSEKKTKTAIFVQTILVKEKGKQATKFSNAYQKALLKEDGKEEDVGLAGKTVIVERTKNGVNFHFADGSEVTGRALKFLQEEYRKNEEPDVQVEDALYPQKPVKIGDSWDCDLEVLVKGLAGGDMPLTIDAKKSTGACKLLKVYQKDGRNFASLDVNVKLAVTQMGPSERAIKFPDTGTFTVNGTFDTCFEGGPRNESVAMKLTIKGNGKIPAPGGSEATLSLDIQGTVTESHSPVDAK